MRIVAWLIPVLIALPLGAQERADSTTPDSTERPRRRPPPHSSNPYLREVRDDEPEQVRAERLHQRRGLWASIGAGAGNESVLFTTPGTTSSYSASRTRPTFNAAIGGTVGQFMRLGLEGFVWFNPHGDGPVETISSVMFGARVYPFPGTGLYAHGAGGMGFYHLEDYYDPCGCHGPYISDVGGAWSFGAGLELPVSRGVWLTPNVEFVYVDMLPPVDYRERVIHVGLSITFDGH